MPIGTPSTSAATATTPVGKAPKARRSADWSRTVTGSGDTTGVNSHSCACVDEGVDDRQRGLQPRGVGGRVVVGRVEDVERSDGDGGTELGEHRPQVHLGCQRVTWSGAEHEW